MEGWCSVEELVQWGFAHAPVVMTNEAHSGLRRCARTREVGVRMVRAAHEAGVRRLAMEALAGYQMGASAKYRNVRANPHVAFVVDEVTAPTMEGAHFLEIRGRAETAVGPDDPTGHLSPEVIRIHPRRIISFNVDPARPGFAARDIEAAK